MELDRRTFIRRALREPTLHFGLLAAVLFLMGAAAKSWNRPVVEIDRRSVDFRIRQLERGRGAPLSEAERGMAQDAYVDEQILAREARIRGLDDDERIRAILHQKMLHILASDVPQPSDAELRRYYDDNRARYAGRPAVTVEDRVIRDSFRPVLREASFDPDSITQEEPPRALLRAVTEGELAWSFGEETATEIFAAPTGTWVGPHESAVGQHWFRVVDRIDGAEAPPLDAIREQVRFDWMAQKEEELLGERTAELRRRYAVRFTEGGTEP